MAGSDIAIVIPAWNEEKTIHNVVSQVLSYGKVIVIDDSSTDNTLREAEKAGAIVVSHGENRGYDEALNTGFNAAYSEGCQYVITIDADGQHNHELIESYIDYLKNKGIPLVLGIRPQKARFAEFLMGIYFRIRFNVSDILCGMKGYNINLLRENKGFDHVGSIGTELAFLSIKRGYKFIEINVPIQDRAGKSRFGNILKSNLRIIRALLQIIKLDLKTNYCFDKKDLDI